MGDVRPARAGTINRTGVYLAILQLVFTLGWTVYVIYLPRLAAQVGIAPTAVIQPTVPPARRPLPLLVSPFPGEGPPPSVYVFSDVSPMPPAVAPR